MHAMLTEMRTLADGTPDEVRVRRAIAASEVSQASQDTRCSIVTWVCVVLADKCLIVGKMERLSRNVLAPQNSSPSQISR
jgi:hypothetical protein